MNSIDEAELYESIARFLAWETASRDTIDFKKAYVDIAHDLITGLVLSQIIYWHLPGHSGVTKLRVSHDGNMWIAKSRNEWYDEIRVTGKQLDRALEILEGLRDPRKDQSPLIETSLYKFDGAPTKHIRLLWENFLSIVTESILPKGQNPFYPNGEIHFDQRAKSLTESTAQTTTEIAKSFQQSLRAAEEPGIKPSGNSDLKGSGEPQTPSSAVPLSPAKRQKKPKATVLLPADAKEVQDAICVFCYNTPDGWKANAARIVKSYNELLVAFQTVSIDDVRKVYRWWYSQDWRGKKKQPPELGTLKSIWATALAWKEENPNDTTTQRQVLGNKPNPWANVKRARIPGR